MQNDKLDALRGRMRAMGSLAVAFSGGVDSTFLLNVAHQELGPKSLAITATSSTYPERELNEAKAFASSLGVTHVVIRSEELEIAGFAENPKNRCYFCKHELFSKIAGIAREHGVEHIADGSNADDLGDWRPGMQAARELGVVSPLMEAGLTKADIRALSKEMGLPTWNKQSFACLSSRIPYGEKITPDKLDMIGRAEDILLGLGFRQVRVRHHGNLARIEVGEDERIKFFDAEVMDAVYASLHRIGYTFVALDLRGYRTGSMNE